VKEERTGPPIGKPFGRRTDRCACRTDSDEKDRGRVVKDPNPAESLVSAVVKDARSGERARRASGGRANPVAKSGFKENTLGEGPAILAVSADSVLC